MKDQRSRRPHPGVTGIKALASGNPQLSGGRALAAQVPTHQRFHLLLIGFVLCALTLLVYSNSFRTEMVLDSKGLLHDPRIRAATSENVALIFGSIAEFMGWIGGNSRVNRWE
jgi:hypothetical protein